MYLSEPQVQIFPHMKAFGYDPPPLLHIMPLKYWLNIPMSYLCRAKCWRSSIIVKSRALFGLDLTCT